MNVIRNIFKTLIYLFFYFLFLNLHLNNIGFSMKGFKSTFESDFDKCF